MYSYSYIDANDKLCYNHDNPFWNDVEIYHLYLGMRNIKYIDISKLINLETLILFENNLTELDLSKNVNLRILEIDGNNLKEIDLSYNTLITNIVCDLKTNIKNIQSYINNKNINILFL